MTLPASQVPQRLPAGSITDPPYGPWADIGVTNPFFYHLFSDDFDNSLGATGLWTVTLDGGSAAHNAGDGGQITLTTAAATGDYVSMQLPAASFTLPQGTLAGKKMGFLFRSLGVTNFSNAAFVAGMCDQTTTPFGVITDGIYFQKNGGGTVLNLTVAHASTYYIFNIPTANYVASGSTQLDLAWTIDRYGNILISVGPQLVGWIPQSGIGSSSNAPEWYSSLPVLCPTSKLYSGNQPTTVASGYVLTAAVLTPTIAVEAASNAAESLVVDFIGVAKER
jgi:hypothetical protein